MSESGSKSAIRPFGAALHPTEAARLSIAEHRAVAIGKTLEY